MASQRPLAIAVLLLPGVLFLEGRVLFAGGSPTGVPELASTKLIDTLFGIFGVVGVHLPAIMLLLTLFAQHWIGRHSLTLSPKHIGLMAVESMAWSLPLIVLAGVLGLLPAAYDGLANVPMLDSLTIAVGAGIYEEYVFRFVLIACVHALLADAAGVKHGPSQLIAIAASAFVFASFHGIYGTTGVDWAAVVFFTGAGLFLGWLFTSRGLGIAAGAHVVYDIIVLTLLPRIASG